MRPPGFEGILTLKGSPPGTLPIFWCEASGGARSAEIIRNWHDNTWDVARYVHCHFKVECMDWPASYKIFMVQIWA